MSSAIGIGAFYNPHLAPVILDTKGITYLALADPPSPYDPYWPRIHERFTLLLHDYLGQLSEPLDRDELTRARSLAESYRTPWAAEHLQRIHCTPTSAGGGQPRRSLNYVFPPLYTEDFLEAYVQNATALQQHLGVPLALEPIPSYLQVVTPQLSETEFVSRLLERTDCSLLLDLAHLSLSARSLARSPRDLLTELPLHRVIEIHVAGLAWDADLEETWIAPLPPPDDILDLTEYAASRCNNLRAITFDAYSPSLTASSFGEAVHRLQARFG
jgi:uncharacterized protein (UPF0276 family)